MKKYNPAWSSHIPVLTKVMRVSDGPVLELGMGPFSTPILHHLCNDKDRLLVSYDSSKRFFNENQNFATPLHEVRYIENDDWGTAEIENRRWGVVFVDQAPAESRASTAARAAQYADYVVIHDSNGRYNKHYHYDTIYHLFKHRYEYGKMTPHTTVLSNFKDLENIKN